jgi:hypothetical protein
MGEWVPDSRGAVGDQRIECRHTVERLKTHVTRWQG